MAILVLSIGLDTFQEGRAIKAAELLRRSVALKAEVKRDGAFVSVQVGAVVPGDVIRVRAGDIIPADALLLEATSFTVSEAALTGEPYPVEKRPGVVAARSASEASNALFRGAVAQTGEALALVVGTGRATLFGAAASSLAESQAPSPFQRDLRSFGLLIARLTIALVLVVLSAHVLFGRPVLELLMFSVALAVGLTPELLPMITTVTLARGALRMAARKVIVKRLASIHDLGAMTVLCTDKTGTLTSAEITLAQSLDAGGATDDRAARLGAISAELGGDRGALDAALVAGSSGAPRDWTLLARHAFDFNRRLGSVLVDGPESKMLIAKGAPEAVIPRCTLDADGRWRDADGAGRTNDGAVARTLAEQGLRTVAVASRPWSAHRASSKRRRSGPHVRGLLLPSPIRQSRLRGRHSAPRDGGHPGQDPVGRRPGRSEAACRPGRAPFRDRPVGCRYRRTQRRGARCPGRDDRRLWSARARPEIPPHQGTYSRGATSSASWATASTMRRR